MTLEILICTYNDRIAGVADVILYRGSKATILLQGNCRRYCSAMM